MLKKLSRTTNFILIGIVVGLFVGVSIRQAWGDTNVPGTARADNLTVNLGATAENGLIVANGNLLVPNGNIGIGTTTPTTSLDVVGDIKTTGSIKSNNLCIGATCINETQLQALLAVGGTGTGDTGTPTVTSSFTPSTISSTGSTVYRYDSLNTTHCVTTHPDGTLTWDNVIPNASFPPTTYTAAQFPNGLTTTQTCYNAAGQSAVSTQTLTVTDGGGGMDGITGNIKLNPMFPINCKVPSGASTCALSLTWDFSNIPTGYTTKLRSFTTFPSTVMPYTLPGNGNQYSSASYSLAVPTGTHRFYAEVRDGAGSVRSFPELSVTITCDTGLTPNSAGVCTSGATVACGSTVTFPYNGASVTYGTVTGADGKCWMDRNLGATRVATSATDSASYGHLFQWGRGDDGHQVTTSGTTVTKADVPGNNLFIKGHNDWRVTPSDTLWANSSTNNPCPTNWHVPTHAEWVAVVNPAGSANDITNPLTAYSSTLKLTLAGERFDGGSLASLGSNGGYWSSSPAGTTSASNVYLYSTQVNPASTFLRANGFSVRCVHD